MDLIVSVFITDKRWSHTVNFCPNRFSRFDIFKETLKSYTKFKFDKVLLFVKLDDNYAERWPELAEYCAELFGPKASLEPRRLEKQEEWVPIISQISENKLIFFCQNDDHVFIDFDMEVFNEGLDLLKQDPYPKKGLAYSHWPECIRIAGLGASQRMGKSYIKFIKNFKDPLFIWSQPVLKEIFIDNKWPETLWKPGMTDALPFDISPYHVYVPLRELCRHFDGYLHVEMSEDDFPKLTLPLGNFRFTESHLRARFRTPHKGDHYWLPSNIPKEWEDTMIELYKPITE